MLFIFSTPMLITHLWQLETVVFLHWCLICAVLLPNKQLCPTEKIYLKLHLLGQVFFRKVSLIEAMTKCLRHLGRRDTIHKWKQFYMRSFALVRAKVI